MEPQQIKLCWVCKGGCLYPYMAGNKVCLLCEECGAKWFEPFAIRGQPSSMNKFPRGSHWMSQEEVDEFFSNLEG